MKLGIVTGEPDEISPYSSLYRDIIGYLQNPENFFSILLHTVSYCSMPDWCRNGVESNAAVSPVSPKVIYNPK